MTPTAHTRIRVRVLAALAGAALTTLVAAPPLAAEEVTLAYNGLTLNAEHRVPPDSDSAGPTVLITHGTLAHNRMEIIAALQDTLAERGINSLAINLSLGVDNRHGSYDCAQPHHHKHTDAMAEIGAWVDWLKEQGVSAITLAGHSRGGNQTAWYAAEHDDPAIKGVVLIAPALWDAEAFAAHYEQATGTSLADVLGEAHSQEPDAMLTLDRFLYCADAEVAAGTVLDYYADDARRNTPSLLPDIDEPTVVVVGTADDVVPGLLGAMEGLAGDTVTVKVVPGATHYFRDLYVEDLADAVTEVMGTDVMDR
ncbi:alpha/beta hydrolase [Roseospira marina]|uniref:Alpha/beta hydrolase n=1 Tax=Roseospira marina TaxID=140057 RepID=A0A5M6IAU1_9PROT|nr:alpha/beta fold hydrolase [Roseospira marina]KAA5605232.1 alpha/beta hydrolase [Roseospira marina]MBB4314688.1 pimeloyl-ACP methyl ester carboxylesterase [Roseospira marina]MBB5087677.1 pimeloyl-ACP methyl ester carboxylesterase [Roseospira marina]